MNKRIFCLFAAMCVGFAISLLAGCSQTTTKTEESTTIVELPAENKPQSNEVSKENSKDIAVRDSTNVRGESTVWTSEENDAAERIASEFVSDLKNRDMAAISKKILYPIEITTTGGQKMTITNEGDFSALAFDDVFSKKFVGVMSRSKELFSNWRGFMLGEGSDLIWISPQENGEMRVYAIVTSNSQSDAESE